jgi:hypothetical protein
MRLFNPGTDTATPETAGDPTQVTTVVINGIPHVKVPLAFCQEDPNTGRPREELRPCPLGSVVFGFPEFGFFVVEKGKWWDAPSPLLTEEVVKRVVPHFLTEAEHKAWEAKQKTKTRGG